MITCGACGRQSETGFRFCPHCGAPLEAAPPAPPRTERRLVTILFCDLVGFTARSDRADPEDVRALIEPFHDLTRRAIERHGGTVDKFIGDAAMGVFGSPVAHEDDAERAVRAAVDIAEEIAVLNEGREEDPLAVRIGISTGEAAVAPDAEAGQGERILGDVVNTAARIQTAAEAGAILVGEATQRATAGAVDYEELPAVSAKGKAEPLRVWRARAMRRVGGTSDRTGAAPFVGRTRELATLEDALRAAVDDGVTGFVTISGEPGVGKSRLVAELRAACGALPVNVRWYRGRCLSYGEGITFWALGEIVKAWAGIKDSDPASDREAKLEAALAGIQTDPSERAWFKARLAPLAGLEAGAPVEREEAFTAWRRLLEDVARTDPLVLVFEDLHWADPALLAFLDHVAANVASSRLLIVGTTRPELLERHPSWGPGAAATTVLTLLPLDAEETERLVAGLLRSRSLPTGTRDLLLQRSGGNPLFAEELVRTLRDRGLVGPQGELVGDDSGLELPPTVHALIAARLDALDPEQKGLLQAASVIGRVFWSGAAAALTTRDEAAVRSDLTALAGRELVRGVARSSLDGQAEYAFWHGLLRDVSYATLPRAARIEQHRAAAEWIEGVGGGNLEDVAEILVHHATSALDLARAAGASDVEALSESAARYLRLAAARAMSLDVERAMDQLRRALELLPASHPDRAHVLSALGEANLQSGRLEEADAAFAEAAEGLLAAGDDLDAADAMVRRSVVLEYRGETSAGWTLLAEAIRTLEALPPSRELARAYATSAGSAVVSGRYGEGIPQAERAIALAGQVGEPQAAARGHAFRGFARLVTGDADGIAEQREALHELIGLGLVRAAAVTYNNLGSALILSDGPGASLEVLREGVAFAESRGVREMVTAIHNSTITPLLDFGEWDEVLRLANEIVEEGRRTGSVYDEVYAMADIGFVRAWREGAEALAFCEEVLERMRPLGEPPLLQSALVAAGIARNAAGDAAGTADLVREAVGQTQGDGLAVRLLDVHHLTRLALAADDLPLAEHVLEGTEGARLERYLRIRNTARAALLEARGRTEEALNAYRNAAVEWAEWGVVLEEGLAHLGAARCSTALGRASEATPHREAARDRLDRLGIRSA